MARAAWALYVASALYLGATAGVPFASWAQVGFLPSIVFACIACLFVLAGRRPGTGSPSGAGGDALRKGPGWLAVAVGAPLVGACVGMLFGQVGSDTYFSPLSCFSIGGKHYVWFGGDTFGQWLLVSGAVGAFAALVVGLILRGRAARWQRPLSSESSEGSLAWSGAVFLLSGALWSLANETFNLLGGGDPHQDCNPDIGPVATLGFVLAMASFGLALQKRLEARRGTQAALVAAALGLAVCAAIGQVSASLAVAQHAQRDGCGCRRAGPTQAP